MPDDAPATAQPWWQRGIFYQIYPLSFADSNGDGYGDLEGIRGRLDYVASLGVDAIWLSPIYPSPMSDHGYDISDHTAIHPLFGTLDDFDLLLAEVHRRGMRLILDLVPNQTSDQHAWFIDSRSSRSSPKRNWYIWRDPAPNGGPPNNWIGFFGPAWTLDDVTGQYYLRQRHDMPELNYRNPAVLEAMLGVMRFWLDRGVDGFRVDVIWLLLEDDRFLDEPANPEYRPHQNAYYSLRHIYTADQDDVHEIVREMRRTLDSYAGERVMLGEVDVIPRLMNYYGADLDECHLPFNLNLTYQPWRVSDLKRVIDDYDAAIPPGAWPNWILGNHDQPRIASRVGPRQVRNAQVLLLTLRGTPICYYGDELGMTDGQILRDRVRDAMGYDDLAVSLSRDPERTPMQWSAEPNAGFAPAAAAPWLPLSTNYREVNVALESTDSGSVLSLFRALVRLRREQPAIMLGAYRSIDVEFSDVFVYERSFNETRVFVVLNFSGAQRVVDLRQHAVALDVLLSTDVDRAEQVTAAQLTVRPDEGLVLRPRASTVAQFR